MVGAGLVRYGSEGPGTPGLWSLDPGSGQVHQVFSDQTPAAVQGSNAWFQTTNPADSQAITDARTGDKLPDQILRRDLGSGPSTPWFYRPGHWAQLIGLDSSGHPFVALSKSQEAGSAATLWFVSVPNVGRPIFQGTVLDTSGLSFNITDKNGTWFGGTSGVYLYDGGDLIQVSSSGARPAGRCA